MLPFPSPGTILLPAYPKVKHASGQPAGVRIRRNTETEFGRLSCVHKKLVQDRLAGIQIKPSRYLLVYLPFEIRHHDLVQTTFNIAVNRNQLALAGNL
jgi:hypothetical protein